MEESPPEPLPSPTPLPRLRIHHLMIWMAAVAVISTVYAKGFSTSRDSFSFALSLFTSAIPQAVGIATLSLGIYWRCQGSKFFQYVGHWLLILTALDFINLLLSWVPDFIYRRNPDSHLSNLYLIAYLTIALSIAAGLLFIFVGRRIADTKKWTLFCYFLSAGLILQGFLVFAFLFFNVFRSYLISSVNTVKILSFILPITNVIACMICMLAVREDFKNSRSLHWSHYCGILTWAITKTASFTFSALNLFE